MRWSSKKRVAVIQPTSTPSRGWGARSFNWFANLPDTAASGWIEPGPHYHETNTDHYATALKQWTVKLILVKSRKFSDTGKYFTIQATSHDMSISKHEQPLTIDKYCDFFFVSNFVLFATVSMNSLEVWAKLDSTNLFIYYLAVSYFCLIFKSGNPWV